MVGAPEERRALDKSPPCRSLADGAGTVGIVPGNHHPWSAPWTHAPISGRACAPLSTNIFPGACPSGAGQIYRLTTSREASRTHSLHGLRRTRRCRYTHGHTRRLMWPAYVLPRLGAAPSREAAEKTNLPAGRNSRKVWTLVGL